MNCLHESISHSQFSDTQRYLFGKKREPDLVQWVWQHGCPRPDDAAAVADHSVEYVSNDDALCSGSRRLCECTAGLHQHGLSCKKRECTSALMLTTNPEIRMFNSILHQTSRHNAIILKILYM
jgi:hypothetical protein